MREHVHLPFQTKLHAIAAFHLALDQGIA
jgi:hypothetical protein